MKKEADIKKLDTDIKTLNKSIEKSNSLLAIFIRGVVSGTGTAIGASIIATIIITLVLKSIHTAEGVPILDQIIENINLTEFLAAPTNR